MVGSQSYTSNSHELLESGGMVTEHLELKCREEELYKPMILLTLWPACYIPMVGGGGERMLRGAQARAAPSDSLDLFNRELLA